MIQYSNERRCKEEILLFINRYVMTSFLKYSVGVDVSKDDLHACFSGMDINQHVTIKGTRKFANTPAGHKQFESWVVNKHKEKEVPVTMVMEATGVYYEMLAWYLHRKGFNLAVVLPTRARRYAESIGLKSKNDSIDAKGLARLGAEQNLEEWKPVSENLYVLRMLTRQVEQLNNHKTVVQNQLHAYEHMAVQMKQTERLMKKHIRFLEKQLLQTKEQIHQVISEDDLLCQHVQRITEIKGVGELTAAVLIAECNGFELIKNQRQLTSYAGYDVMENQSGKRAGKTRISKKGNAHIRRCLHMPAFNAVKYEPRFKQFYDRLRANGKTKMQAYVAVQRKLLALTYCLWKTQQPYNPRLIGQITDQNESSPTQGATLDRQLVS